jgi:cytochrome c-type biogenesis protein CcmE
MSGKKIKYIVGLIIIICAFAYLVWSSFMGSFNFSITPSEFVANQSAYVGKIVKLSGSVVPGSIVFDQSDYRFSITDGDSEIAAHYKGIVPNTFREGADVVVTGQYDSKNSIFEAKEMITKCASKYEGK